MTAFRSPFRLSVLTALAVAAPAANAPVRLFHAPVAAAPGDALPFQGHFGPGVQFYCVSAGQPVPRRVFPVAVAGVSMLQVNSAILQWPTDAAYDEYLVWPFENGVNYAAVALNRPQVEYAPDPECYGGGMQEIHGDVLTLPGLTPTVTLTPADGSAGPLTAPLLDSTDMYLKYTVPTGVVSGKSYVVKVRNGAPGGVAVELAERLLCLAPGLDYLGVGDRLPSAVKYRYGVNTYRLGPGVRDSRLPASAAVAGNGTTDDTAAIQAAMTYIAGATVNGVQGGVLELLPATYLMAGEARYPSSNCAVRGVGSGVNVVTPTGGANAGKNPFVAVNTTNCAWININLTNRSTTATTQANLWASFYFNGNTGFLIKGGSVALNESTWLNLQNNTRLCWLDTVISQGVAANASPRRGPATIFGSARTIIDGLQIASTIDAMDCTFQRGLTIKNCAMTWNGGLGNRQTTVVHMFALSGKNFYCRNNYTKSTYVGDPKVVVDTYRAINGDPTNHGEQWIVERAGSDADNVCGQVATATATTLTTVVDYAQSFSGLALPTAVVITTGRGAGQQRTVTAGNGAMLTVSQAWDIQPDATSAYSVCPWSGEEFGFENNLMEFGKRSILLYYVAARRFRIKRNTCRQCGSIDLTTRLAKDEAPSPTPGRIRMTTMHDAVVQGNVVDGRGDPVQGAAISLHPNPYKVADMPGTAMWNVQVLGNQVFDDRYRGVWVDALLPSGISVYTQYQADYEHGPAPEFNSRGIPATIGVVIDRNSTTGCQYGVYTGGGVANVLVRAQTNAGCRENVVSVALQDAKGAARNFLQLS